MNLSFIYIFNYLSKQPNNEASIEDLCKELYRSETLKAGIQPGDIIGNLIHQRLITYNPNDKMIKLFNYNGKLLS